MKKYSSSSKTAGSTLGLTDDELATAIFVVGGIALVAAATRGAASYTRGYDDGQRDMLSRTVLVKNV